MLFSPPVEEVYPEGFATTVTVGGLTEMLEGDEAQRGAEHFQGVDDRRHQALQHGRARTWRTSARRTPSRRS